MESENDGFQEELPFLGTSFQVPYQILGVYRNNSLKPYESGGWRFKSKSPARCSGVQGFFSFVILCQNQMIPIRLSYLY